MAARISLDPGPPTFERVSRWLDLASNALYARSDDDLEELVIQLEQERLNLIRREVRSTPKPETYDDLIDEDPEEEDEKEDDPKPFRSRRRFIPDPSELDLRLAAIRATRSW